MLLKEKLAVLPRRLGLADLYRAHLQPTAQISREFRREGSLSLGPLEARRPFPIQFDSQAVETRIGSMGTLLPLQIQIE
jgi:hypothetical protein